MDDCDRWVNTRTGEPVKVTSEPWTCPACGATDHERGPDLFGVFPVILCPTLEEHRIVLGPPI
jgi:hypothetical protein